MTTPDTTCLFPHLAPSTASVRGCRCERCVAWSRANDKARAKNSEKRKNYLIKRKNSEAAKKYHRDRYYSEEGKAILKAWAESPSGQASKLRYLAYTKTPRGKAVNAARAGRRRAWKRKQSPKLTNTEWQQVVAIYKRCQDLTESTGVMHHVDHIIPLSKGGEHHPNNIQILTAEENMKKGDRILP